MNFFDFFRKKRSEPKQFEFPWIEATDNPWNLRLLDLRPLTQTMLSWSTNPQVAENALSYGGEDGTSFWNTEPEETATYPSSLSFAVDGVLYPGALFIPRSMEQKWAVFYDGENMIFVRSWQRKVIATARTRQENGRLIVESIRGDFLGADNESSMNANLNFLLLNYVLGEVSPVPFQKELETAEPQSIAQIAFSVYGNRAHFAVFDEGFMPEAKKSLRSISLLHFAAAHGDALKIEELLKTIPDPNCRDPFGHTPLHWSFESPKTETLEKLLNRDADVNAATDEGTTPLMSAMEAKDMAKTKCLLKAGAAVNAADHRGFTALHRAGEMGFGDGVKILLDHGAVQTASKDGHTPLSLAQTRCENAVVELLNK